MPSGQLLFQMCEVVDVAEALRIVAAIAAGPPATMVRKVYYPYYWFTADCKVRTLLGLRAFSVNCLVDARNGFCATADSFDTEKTTATADAVLAATAAPDDAKEAARRILTHGLRNRLRMLAKFNVETRAMGLIHKTFWVVRCAGAVLMVDGMTGSLHPLFIDRR